MASKKILIIEDDESLRLALRTKLAQEGYEVVEAKDGAAGLELASTARPDLVLLDFDLPKLKGTEVLKGVREKGGQMPIILLTNSVPIDLLRGEVPGDQSAYYLTKTETTLEGIVGKIKSCIN